MVAHALVVSTDSPSTYECCAPLEFVSRVLCLVPGLPSSHRLCGMQCSGPIHAFASPCTLHERTTLQRTHSRPALIRAPHSFTPCSGAHGLRCTLAR
jgi:hypothetical protein